MKSKAEIITKGRAIDKVDTLVEKFGGKANKWKKMKTWTPDGSEIHWYGNPGSVKLARSGRAFPTRSEVAMRVKVRSNFRSLAEDGLGHPGLTAEAEFYVLGVDDEYYRLVNRLGEPVLYPKELFEVLDASVPTGWRFCEYDDGEYHLEPTSTGEPGFFEDWHGSNGDRAAQEAARQIFRGELLRLAADADPADQVLLQEALSRLPPGTEPPLTP